MMTQEHQHGTATQAGTEAVLKASPAHGSLGLLVQKQLVMGACHHPQAQPLLVTTGVLA
jgi:hypothetical protein